MKFFLLLIVSFIFSFAGFSQQKDIKNENATPSKKVILQKGGIKLIGGSGNSINDAILITGAKDEKSGVDAENYLFEKSFGKKNIDWKVLRHKVINKGDRVYELLWVQTKSPERKLEVYFDITEFFGKW